MAYTLKLIEGSGELDLHESATSGFWVKTFNPGLPEELDIYGGQGQSQLIRKQYGPRDMQMVLKLSGSDRDDMIDRLNDLRMKLKAASDYHETGWGDEVFLRFQFDGATYACQWPILSGSAQPENELLHPELPYAMLRDYQMFVLVNLRTKAEWEATTTYSLENEVDNANFEKGSGTIGDRWSGIGAGATGSLDTTIYLIGTRSQKVITDTDGDEGIQSASKSNAATSAVAYAWVYKASGDEVAVELYDATGEAVKDTALYSAAGWATKTGADDNTWKRLIVSSDSLTGNNSHRIRILRRSGDATQATTYYADQCYFEFGTTTTPTGWWGGSDIYNHWDSGSTDYNYGDFCDIPGDTDALCKLKVKNTSGANQETLLAFMDNAIARYQAMYEAEDYNVAGTDTAEAGNSGGSYNTRTVSESGSTWNVCFQFDLVPSDIEEFSGPFRLLGRARDETTWDTTGNFRYRIAGYQTSTSIIKNGPIMVGSGHEIQDFGVVKLQPDVLGVDQPMRVSLFILAQKQAGESNYTLAVDYFILAPLYQATVAKIAPSGWVVGNNEYFVLDSDSGQDYLVDSAEAYSEFTFGWVGNPLTLPAQTEGRIYFLMGDTDDDYEIAATMRVSVEYTPRGLHFRGSDL